MTEDICSNRIKNVSSGGNWAIEGRETGSLIKRASARPTIKMLLVGNIAGGRLKTRVRGGQKRKPRLGCRLFEGFCGVRDVSTGPKLSKKFRRERGGIRLRKGKNVILNLSKTLSPQDRSG